MRAKWQGRIVTARWKKALILLILFVMGVVAVVLQLPLRAFRRRGLIYATEYDGFEVRLSWGGFYKRSQCLSKWFYASKYDQLRLMYEYQDREGVTTWQREVLRRAISHTTGTGYYFRPFPWRPPSPIYCAWG